MRDHCYHTCPVHQNLVDAAKLILEFLDYDMKHTCFLQNLVTPNGALQSIVK